MHPDNYNCLEKKVFGVGWRFIFFILVSIFFVFFHSHAYAHKVSIFAWVEGDTVYTQSKFGGGKKVKGGQVIVFDPGGNQILEGKTDENGEFSFKIPQKTGLKIVLKASMGHMAQWTIPAQETNQAVVTSNKSGYVPIAKDAGKISSDSTGAKTIKKPPAPVPTCLKPQEIKALIDASLDKKLTPIINMLAGSIDCGPELTEIIGGIGYIFGLVGVALYFATRRRKE